jgi:hypothetical protein
MEFQNDNKDTRLQDALKEIEALKQALFKKGTISQGDIDGAKQP